MISMKSLAKLTAFAIMIVSVTSGFTATVSAQSNQKEIVYLTPGLDLAFWRYLSLGVKNIATEAGYKFQALDSKNSAQTQLENAKDVIARGVTGIVISPTDSSTAPTVLRLAAAANIPVVVADIGADSGKYISFIISDNYKGASGVGAALATAMKAKGKEGGSVGIVGISQARLNGQARTKGFKDALAAGGITRDAGLQQMQSYTADETFKFTQDMLAANPEMTGIFVQTDGPTLGAIQAIKAARMTGNVLVAAFDGIPEFVPLLQSGDLVVSGMQQPYLMGQESAKAMIAHLNGKTPERRIVVPIKIVTSTNINEVLPVIKETVFANEVK